MRKRKITFDQIPSALVEIMERLTAIESTLKAQKAAPAKQSASQDGTINADAASKLIGRTKVTLYNLAKSGMIPARKQGKSWIFVESEIQEWLQKPRVRKKRAQNQPAAATGTGKRRGRKKKVQEAQ